MRPDSVRFIAAASALLLVAAVSSQQCSVRFREITGFLCIQQTFVRTFSNIKSALECSLKCSWELSCQAFSLDDGPCQLFVFNKCSKSVRNCSCSRRGHVFVKQQPGLEPGALCPSGYGDDLCGVKYRVISDTANWSVQRQRCESESGLVIMADVVDAKEMEHVEILHSKYSSSSGSFYLAGFQPPGSPELGGGWIWIGCNITYDGSLWGFGEPSGGGEDVVAKYQTISNLVDIGQNYNLGALCECVSPF